MITLQNESDFDAEFNADLVEVIEWINKNLKLEDVFDKEKLIKHEQQRQPDI